MKQKKILLLGGSFFQIPSIEMVKRLGHYAITCDYRPDNPGHRLADEYHNVSTTDPQRHSQARLKTRNRRHRPLAFFPHTILLPSCMKGFA
jgi:formate-dependent phosphoribosylglycinamide formyltransferase (GAR transformylase)